MRERCSTKERANAQIWMFTADHFISTDRKKLTNTPTLGRESCQTHTTRYVFTALHFVPTVKMRLLPIQIPHPVTHQKSSINTRRRIRRRAMKSPAKPLQPNFFCSLRSSAAHSSSFQAASDHGPSFPAKERTSRTVQMLQATFIFPSDNFESRLGR